MVSQNGNFVYPDKYVNMQQNTKNDKSIVLL